MENLAFAFASITIIIKFSIHERATVKFIFLKTA